jgi:ABC-type glycerol-3-phosphate transport system permease component
MNAAQEELKAAMSLSIQPMLVLLLIAHRWFIAGITPTGLKG